VDWGDGEVTIVKELEYNTSKSGYIVEHDYANSITDSNKRFIVKIYGKDYLTIRHNGDCSAYNLISNVFTDDLPVAPHVVNLASFLHSAKRLLKVEMPYWVDSYSKVWNWSNCFAACVNLISCVYLPDIYMLDNANVNYMFNYCSSLTTTDLVIPANTDNSIAVFFKCRNLEIDILDVLPSNFTKKSIMIKGLFSNCAKVTCTDYDSLSKKLWNNENNIVVQPNEGLLPFEGCSNELRAQVPVSWGGTASDDIIEQPSSAQDAEQNARIAALETHLGMN
jgi:hypothetical protein